MVEANGTEGPAGHDPPPGVEISTAPGEGTWRTELAALLGSGCFPARSADLTAHLVAARAPSRLLWRLSGVNPDTRFDSLAALIAHIEGQAHKDPRLSREPM